MAERKDKIQISVSQAERDQLEQLRIDLGLEKRSLTAVIENALDVLYCVVEEIKSGGEIMSRKTGDTYSLYFNRTIARIRSRTPQEIQEVDSQP